MKPQYVMLLVAFDRFCFVVDKKQGNNTRIIIYPSFVGCFHPRIFNIQGIVRKALTRIRTKLRACQIEKEFGLGNFGLTVHIVLNNSIPR